MYTIPSQLIVCLSALVEDIYKVFGKEQARARTRYLAGCVLMRCPLWPDLQDLAPAAPSRSSFGLPGWFRAAFGPVSHRVILYWLSSRQGQWRGMIVMPSY